MSKPRITAAALVCASACALTSVAAGAVTMDYIFTGLAAGRLGDLPFDESAFTVTGEADASDVSACPNACRYLDFASATVSIAGLGNFAMLSPLRVFNNQGALGLARGGADGVDLYGTFTVPQDYDFAAALGPITQTTSLLQSQASAPAQTTDVQTSGGTLVFASGETLGSFETRMAGVALPSSAWMLGSALVIGALPRRRERYQRR